MPGRAVDYAQGFIDTGLSRTWAAPAAARGCSPSLHPDRPKTPHLVNTYALLCMYLQPTPKAVSSLACRRTCLDRLLRRPGHLGISGPPPPGPRERSVSRCALACETLGDLRFQVSSVRAVSACFAVAYGQNPATRPASNPGLLDANYRRAPGRCPTGR